MAWKRRQGDLELRTRASGLHRAWKLVDDRGLCELFSSFTCSHLWAQVCCSEIIKMPVFPVPASDGVCLCGQSQHHKCLMLAAHLLLRASLIAPSTRSPSQPQQREGPCPPCLWLPAPHAHSWRLLPRVHLSALPTPPSVSNCFPSPRECCGFEMMVFNHFLSDQPRNHFLVPYTQIKS